MLQKKALLVCAFSCLLSVPSFAQVAKNLEVEDLGVDSSPEAVAQAQADLKNGAAILRVKSGSQKDVEQLIGIPLFDTVVKAATGKAPTSRADLLSSPSLQVTAAAAYKDERGVIRSAVVFSSSAAATTSDVQSGLKSLNGWIEAERAREADPAADSADPEPPPEAWTAIYRITLIVSQTNDAELTIGLFRLNSISQSNDLHGRHGTSNHTGF
jgi:hypothetical protein